jgi:hypothetical protein
MGADLTQKLVEVARAANGQDPDVVPPDLFRLGLYRAEVKAAASDGSTLDVAPEDQRLSLAQNVPMRVGIPGAVVVVKAGAVVLLGWEAGDPARPYCTPLWEAGAGVTKLVANADLVVLGAESGAQFIALANLVKSELQAIATALTSHTHSNVTTGSGTTGGSNSTYAANDVAAANAKAK